MTGWVGVDPGARWTGVTGVTGDGAVDSFTIVDRDDDPDTYAIRVEVAVTRAVQGLPGAEVAMENITDPQPYINGRRMFVRPPDLIALGRLIGWLQRAFPDAVMVTPNKHGHHAWAHYPATLITPGEARHAAARPNAEAGQSSTMRHCRSAYDVARAAPQARRMADALARRGSERTTPARRPARARRSA